MRIARIVSGGQTGADRAGLDAAIAAGVEHKGWCPKGRRSEDGVIPPQYNLKETSSPGYVQRTQLNVVGSSATLIFTVGEMGSGSSLTFFFAQSIGRPCLHIDLKGREDEGVVNEIVEWLQTKYDHQDPMVINVAGSRESKAPGIQERVRAIMSLLIARCPLKNKEPREDVETMAVS